MKNIDSFEIITLRESGMRGSVEYEITAGEDGTAKVAFYWLRWNSDAGKDERILDKSSVVPASDIVSTLKKCHVGSWNGFDGPHPKHVLDGIMFRFDAIVNGGDKITAKGSQNFPKGYRDLTDALYNWLKQ